MKRQIREAIREAEHILKCVDISYPEDTVLKRRLDNLLSTLDDIFDKKKSSKAN